MTVETLIREARLSAGLSQGQLAALAHTSQPTISAYENGSQPPNSATLSRLLNACGVTLIAVPATTTQHTTMARMVSTLVENGDFDDEHFVLRWSLNQFARNEWDDLNCSQKIEALRVQPRSTGSRRWDTFYAALAEYLAETSEFPAPAWIDDPRRSLQGHAAVWYPGRSGDPDILQRRIKKNPARWFTNRGIGLEMKALPSGKGKHNVATV